MKPRAWIPGIVAALLLGGGARAADKSGISPNAVSLPKGPGSVEGLGDSFQPTLNTGTAKYGVDIQLPPGTAGHQPSLSLSYDGGAANGPLGFGWVLALPHIQRKTDEGIPTYDEQLGVERKDRFVNHAREELVPIEDGTFFCENESAFIRYRFAGGHWEGTAPDGTRLQFGLTDMGRIQDAATGRVFAWLLERETDTRGNVIEYGYRSFSGEQNLNQKYLSQIRYGPGGPPWDALHLVTLNYEDRPDWFEDGRAGFLVRTGKRLRSISVATQGVPLIDHLAGDVNDDGIVDYLNRRYDLGYLRYDGEFSHWSLLASVKLTGADGVTALPQATFDYSFANPPETTDASSNVWSSVNAPAMVMDNPQVDLVDLNADGLPDLLKTQSGGGGHSVSLNRGAVARDASRVIRWSDAVPVDPGQGTSWNFDLASEHTHLADMNGDGLADLVHKTADNAVFYFANRGQAAWSERLDMASQGAAPPTPFGNPGVRTADIDFDKRIDVIQSIDLGGSTSYRIWFNLGNQTYSEPVTVEPEGGFDLSLPGVQVVDCNGDRVPDLARIRPAAILLSAGLGYGRFSAPRTVDLPDLTLDDLQIAAARLTDINGDGLADLVLERAAPGVCWYWLNLGNYTLAPRRSVIGLPPVSTGASVRWADLNGNGATDLVYADSSADPRLLMVDLGELLGGGLSPNLLTRVENGIGRTISIAYASSTTFALEDENAGRPWPDSLPFPVTVVAGVAVSDSLGHTYHTRYHYHDGYYDPLEKQFRGFAEVEQVDVGDPSAPTLISRSFFDTGRRFEAMKGRVLQVSSETEDGSVFSREVTTWADPPRILRTGTNGMPVRFAHPVATATEVLERGEGTPRRLETEMEYDNYGNQTRLSEYGIVEGSDRSAFDDERVTITEYAVNPDRWIVQTPMRQVVQDEHGTPASRWELFYDDESFSGNNPGSLSEGNLTLRRDWVDPADPAAFVNASRTKYDQYGNAVLQLDPLADAANPASGHARELSYDPALHTHAVRETIHVGGDTLPLVFEVAYDVGLATIVRSWDFNLNETAYTYDALGRLTQVVKPGDTPDYPTAEYGYGVAIPVPSRSADGLWRTGLVNFVETRMLDRAPGTLGTRRDHYLFKRQFTDGLGRALMTRAEAEPAETNAEPRVVVQGAVLFNARSKPAISLSPFFSLRSGDLENLLAYEDVEEPGWRGLFHDGGNLAALDLQGAHQYATEYDATLRMVKSVNPDGTFSRVEFEPLVVRAYDENDCDPDSLHFDTPTLQFKDGLGRLVRLDEIVRINDDGTPANEPKTWTTQYTYDLNNLLTRITDSQANVKVMRYDGLRRKIWMNDPDSGISTFRYDEASNVIETVDAKGQRVSFSYDGANRMLTEDYQDESSEEFSYHRSPDIAFHYDAPAGPVDQGDGSRATARNCRGMLAWVEDASGQQHNSFDARGRVEWEVKHLPDPELGPALVFDTATAVAFKTANAFDSMDRPVRLTYPDNDQLSYRYNSRGLLEGIAGDLGVQFLSELVYPPSGKLERMTYGNGVQTTYNYDSRQRLTGLFTAPATLAAEYVHFAYDLDPVSNIRAILDRRPVSIVPAENPRRNSQRFTYDSLYRLTAADFNWPNPASANGGRIDYRYDRIGNLLAQSSDIHRMDRDLPVANLGELSYGGAAGPTGRVGRLPGEEAGPHALTGVSQSTTNGSWSYDANGNVTAVGGLVCTWDFRDRLVAVEDETMRTDYRYDFTGRRVLKRVFWKHGEPAADGHDPAPTASRPSSTFTLYPARHFEVRDHDQPIKYVVNGSTRIARVVGTFSARDRVQRLRLLTGPNLLSLAVTAENLLEQLQSGTSASGPPVTAAYRWDESTAGYVQVGLNQTVAAGSVLWITAVTNAILSVIGAYVEPVPAILSGDGYLAGPGLEAWCPDFPSSVGIWGYCTSENRWQARVPDGLFPVAELPVMFPPGQALYLTGAENLEIGIPDPTLRLCYYHLDHLGSSTVMTDASGALVQETAFYPFGTPRHEHRLRAVEGHYSFTRKERDLESGLHYFEARYLASTLSRFISADPKFAHPDALPPDEFGAFLAQPQKLNPYAYVLNNPVSYHDPSGLDAKEVADKASSWGGLAADICEAGGAGTTFNLLGVTMKTAEFVHKPSATTGALALWEVDKWAITVLAVPIGVMIQAMDLTEYGPSAFFEQTEKNIQNSRQAEKAFLRAEAAYKEKARILNQAVPRLKAQHKEQQRGVNTLNQMAAQMQRKTQSVLKGDKRSLDELNAEVRRLERLNKRDEREFKRITEENRRKYGE